ncbi:hypothetical protein AN477_08460 [Alicyclobacillus ferrooxydans]|uniref:Uncharacterized protein n=1 Tax=Alicyclobacillus ferrooxydans TaxID=471514 RepID=A0A0P9ELG2_9BACL|nr:hypothetical protein AN477_08460 [Alicyclobacillus ferrooxydans]
MYKRRDITQTATSLWVVHLTATAIRFYLLTDTLGRILFVPYRLYKSLSRQSEAITHRNF